MTTKIVAQENTTPRTNKHGQLECVEVRAEEILHTPICDTECAWHCPDGFEKEAMTPGHRIEHVHDEGRMVKARGAKARRKAQRIVDETAMETAAPAA